MNKKQFIVMGGMIFLLSIFAFAEVETYKMDLDNDGIEEIITTEDRFNTYFEGVVTISGLNKNKLGDFAMPDHLTNIEFISLNNDSYKQVVAWSQGGAHYTNLSIYGYKDKRIYKLFENGSACGIETDFKSESPTIKIGKEQRDKEGWSYVDEPDWEIWNWDGKEFHNEKQ